MSEDKEQNQILEEDTERLIDDREESLELSTEEQEQVFVEGEPAIEDDIPEEWKRERQYFEEHYEEILKPGPKINLVGKDENVAAYSDWDSTQVASRFGAPASDEELKAITTVHAGRRAVAGMRGGRDLSSIFMIIGIPLMFILVLVEVFYFSN